MSWNSKSNCNISWKDWVDESKIDEFEARLEKAIKKVSESLYEQIFKEEIEAGDVIAFF